MLFEIIALLSPLLCIWCYRQGVRDGMNVKAGKRPDPIIKRPPRPPNKEQQYFNAIERNLEAYDGTDKHQKEVNI